MRARPSCESGGSTSDGVQALMRLTGSCACILSLHVPFSRLDSTEQELLSEVLRVEEHLGSIFESQSQRIDSSQARCIVHENPWILWHFNPKPHQNQTWTCRPVTRWSSTNVCSSRTTTIRILGITRKGGEDGVEVGVQFSCLVRCGDGGSEEIGRAHV